MSSSRPVYRQSYPNDEPPTKPFFEKWVAVSTKVMVRLSPAAYATHAATNTTSIACQLTFTGKDATHAAVTKSANISLRYSRDLCWPPTKAKLAAQQPCGGASQWRTHLTLRAAILLV